MLAALAGCGNGSGITHGVAPPSGGFTNSNLNGTYVFSVSGTDQVGSSPYAIVGAFTANGSGGITGGTLDINDADTAVFTSGPVADSAIGSGSGYSVGVDGRGTATLNTSTPFGKIVLDFALQDSSHGLVTEFDANGSGSGTLDLQASGTTPKGTYAFSFSGGYNSTIVGTVGNFTLGSGGSVTGLEDFNSEGIPYADETLSGTVVLGPSSTPATHLVAAPSAGSANFAIAYDVYAIDASHLKFIEMDTTGTLSGDAFSQTSTAMPTNSTLAFTLFGGTTSTVVAAGGFLVTDASGNITNASTEDVNNTGSVSATFVNFSAPTTAGGTGRYVLGPFSGFVGGTDYVAYPSSGGLFLLEIDTAGLMSGAAYPQTSGATFAASQGYALNLSGTNLGATTGTAEEVDDIAEFTANSSGATVTGVLDENYAPGGGPNYGIQLSGNYTAPSGGRGGIGANVGNATNGSLNGGFTLTFYTVDGTNFPFIETDQGQVSAGVFVLQNASATSSAAKAHTFFVPPIIRPHGALRKQQ